MYGRSSARLLSGGSVARRRGTDVLPVRRSTLPVGRPLPWTASIRIRVISCERVRCSRAARRRSDSLSSLGTYAPIKTPLRFAMIQCELLISCIGAEREKEQAYKPNFVLARKRVTIIHLGRRLPDGSSDLPGNAATPKRCLERATQKRFPIWSCTTRSLPGLDCYQPSRWALTPPFHPSPLSRLVYFLLHLSSPAETGARTLSGSLPYGVRTFLFSYREATVRPAPSARLSEYSKKC